MLATWRGSVDISHLSRFVQFTHPFFGHIPSFVSGRHMIAVFVEGSPFHTKTRVVLMRFGSSGIPSCEQMVNNS